MKLKYGISSSLAAISDNHNNNAPSLTIRLSSQVSGVPSQVRKLLANQPGRFLTILKYQVWIVRRSFQVRRDTVCQLHQAIELLIFDPWHDLEKSHDTI